MRGLAAVVAPAAESARTISEWDVPWNRSVLAGGSNITELTAFNLSAVWASQTLIADAGATLPVGQYRKQGEMRERVELAAWLEKPNPETTRINYETQRLLSLLGWGNSYALLLREGGVTDPRAPVKARYIVDPWRVRPFRSPKTGELLYDVNGKTYLAAQVQHVPGYVRPGELCGMSVIEHARRSLGLGAQAEAFGEKFYQNGVTANVAIEMPQMPGDVQDAVVNKIRETVADRYAGAGNAFRPLVLMGGTTAKALSITPNDAQFLETRKFQVTEIARWFRVPPHMIGDVEKSTSWGTGIEQQTLGFAKFTLEPWINRLEEADSALLPAGEFIKYNLNAYARADLKTRYEVHEIAVRAGLAVPDERRALEDEPPMIGGAMARLPLNTSLLTDATAQFDPATGNLVGALIRAGYDPADVLKVLGLPDIKHTGLVPVTVSGPDGPTQGAPNGTQ